MKIKIDNTEYEVERVRQYDYLPYIETEAGEYYVAQDAESSGAASEQYWIDLSMDDPEEFTCLVGQETLVEWALGRSAGPGSVCVNSLEEWFELTSRYPAEQWAGYDGEELDVYLDEELAEELEIDPKGDWTPAVAYRNN